MRSFIGIGTTLYGEKDYDKINHFYTTTKWFILFLFPIIPIASYRVKRTNTKLTFDGFFVGANSQYEMNKIKLDKKQVIITYVFTYGIFALYVYSGSFPELSPFIVPIIIILPIIFVIRSAVRRKSIT